jgi:hypothetical protein
VLSLGVDRCGVRTHAIKLSGATARDRGIGAELDRYIDRNYGNAERAVPPTSEHLPSRQRRALGELTDNIAELKGSIERIAVDHTVVTVKTDLDRDKEGLQTARLICTVIYGADVADFTKGHRVVGADSTVLVECSPRTSPLE